MRCAAQRCAAALGETHSRWKTINSLPAVLRKTPVPGGRYLPQTKQAPPGAVALALNAGFARARANAAINAFRKYSSTLFSIHPLFDQNGLPLRCVAWRSVALRGGALRRGAKRCEAALHLDFFPLKSARLEPAIEAAILRAEPANADQLSSEFQVLDEHVMHDDFVEDHHCRLGLPAGRN